MGKTAWVFPGQGSQAIGMGADLVDIPEAKQRLNHAAEILGWDVSETCQNIEDKVSQTLYTQPCLYVIESILVDLMRSHGHQPDLVAGHSLGEYVALYTAGVFDFEAGLHLVRRRAELMSSTSDGMMAALIGFDAAQLEEQLQATPNVVLANDNNSGQVVISGRPDAVKTVLANVKAKKAVPLNVSGAFHSPMMAPAATEFDEVLSGVVFKAAQIPVLSNTDPSPSIDSELLKQRLSKQMTGSVRWREISLQLAEEGVEQAIEIGPGKVLTGLIKRTCKTIKLQNINTAADMTV